MFTVLQYLYLLRFPLLSAGALALFGPAATGAAASLLSGMFDLTWRQTLAVAYFAAWVASTCFFSTQLVLLYARIRVGLELPPSWKKTCVGVQRATAAFCLLYAAAAGLFLRYL